MKIWIFAILLCYSSSEETQKYPENTADISSINNLDYKPPITLDPKIRKALLNVLNRLELQQDNYNPDKTETASPRINQIEASVTNDSANDIKWEYKVNDTFKEYNYYEILSDDSNKKSSSYTNEEQAINDEPGALFFQLPDAQEQAFEKHESLNLQETKNALSNADNLLSARIQEEIEIPKPTANETTKQKNEIGEKDVEVFQAPLLTAFTLEHDERGLPRRIIPLESFELRSILDNRIGSESQDIRRAREQQTPALIRNSLNTEPLFQEEQKRIRIRFELESQFQELQERKRQIELEKERLFAEHEKARRFKFALEQRQKEQEYLRALNQNEIAKSEIALQKSIEPQLSFNLFDRQLMNLQPTRSLPAQTELVPQINYLNMIDRQLQHLFHKSGLSQGRQEDLNIVSKILALNHEGEEDEKSKSSSEKLLPERFNNDLKTAVDLQNKRIIRTEQSHYNQFYPRYKLRN